MFFKLQDPIFDYEIEAASILKKKRERSDGIECKIYQIALHVEKNVCEIYFIYCILNHNVKYIFTIDRFQDSLKSTVLEKTSLKCYLIIKIGN